MFKYFNYQELKEICQKLDNKNCYFRHPKSDFVRHLGQETVNKLLEAKCIKDSPKLEAYWVDYHEPCYEFCNKFKIVFNYITSPFWLWFKVYVLRIYWFRLKWQKFRIWCGHHYDWQDYDGIYNLDEI